MPYRTLSPDHNGALRTHDLALCAPQVDSTALPTQMALCTHISLQIRPTNNLALCALTTLALCALQVVSFTIDAPSTPNWRTSSVTHPDRHPGDPRRRTVQQRGHDRTQRHEEVVLDNFSQNTLFDQFDLTLNMPLLILDMFVLIFDMFW